MSITELPAYPSPRGPVQENRSHAELTEEELFRMYDVYINYIRHENDLIHQRTTWLVTIQGGFILILSFLFQKSLDVLLQISKVNPAVSIASQSTKNVCQSKFESNLWWIFLLFILFWGIVSSLGFFSSKPATYSINAAIQAQNEIKQRWDQLFLARADRMGFPKLMGGGDIIAGAEGACFARNLSVIFGVFWFTLSALLLFFLISFGFQSGNLPLLSSYFGGT